MYTCTYTYTHGASQVALVVKNPPANAGTRDSSSIPGSGRSPGVGNGSPLQCSFLENSMDRGAWWTTVRGVAKSRTLLSTHTRTYTLRRILVRIDTHIHMHVHRFRSRWINDGITNEREGAHTLES